LEESAQVWGSLTDAASLRIRPGPITGPASEAYVADRSRADWLTPADAELLRTLLDRYYAAEVAERVRRGLWHHEFAARALDIAARWTSVVTGLEALFNTDPEFVTRQFRERCAAAAAELGITLTPQDAGRAYAQRSRFEPRRRDPCRTWNTGLVRTHRTAAERHIASRHSGRWMV
jgi:hypothetical protein